MTTSHAGTSWAELQAVLKRLRKRQRQAYHERVASWTRELKQILPDEALLLIAQAVENHTQPNGPKLRRIVEQFTRPENPRPAA